MGILSVMGACSSDVNVSGSKPCSENGLVKLEENLG